MNGKYNVTVDGHPATVSITLDGKGGFAGTVETTEYGQGAISNGKVDGENLSGDVSLDGYDADFAATISGASITGTISYGWFIKKSFTGIADA